MNIPSLVGAEFDSERALAGAVARVKGVCVNTKLGHVGVCCPSQHGKSLSEAIMVNWILLLSHQTLVSLSGIRPTRLHAAFPPIPSHPDSSHPTLHELE